MKPSTHLINHIRSIHPTTPGAGRLGPNRARQMLGLLAAGWLLAGAAPADAATRTWTNAAGDLKWSTPVNWSANFVPATGDTARFDTNGAVAAPGTVNCIIDVSTNLTSMYLMNSNSALFHTLQLKDGVTLSITSPPTGYGIWSSPQVAVSAANPVINTITGPNATVIINPVTPQGYLSVIQGAASAAAASMNTLDMSGLGTFSANLTRVYVAGTGASGAYDRAQGTWKMARTNTIVCADSTATDFLVGNGNSGNQGVGGAVELGQTNSIFADTGVGVGLRQHNNARLYFGPGVVDGYAFFRSRNGGRQNRWQIGDGGLNQSGAWGAGGLSRTGIGTVDFTSGTVDALVQDLVVGRAGTNATYDASGDAEGYLTFNKGVIDANTAVIGYAAWPQSCKTIGQVNVDGTGQLTVNNYLVLGNFQSIYPGGSAKLNLGTITGGGSVKVYGNLATITNDLSVGTSDNDSEIHLRNGGTLYVRGTVGPLNTLELNGGALTLDYGATAPTLDPVCVTANLSTGPGSTLNVQGTAFALGQFPLIRYQTLVGGNGFGDVTFTMPSVLGGYFSNNVANNSIDLVITNVLITTWVGQTNGVNVGYWDIGVTKDWKDQNGLASPYRQSAGAGSAVIFDDTAPGTTTVSLMAAALSPVSITANNSALNYSFTGSGGLTGIASLFKSGSGMLTVGNSGANNFTGPIALNGGTLRLSAAADRLPASAVVTLADAPGVVLDLNGQNQTLSALNGGAGSAVTLGTGALTLTGGGATYDGVISGNGRLVKTNVGVAATQTLTGANTYTGGTIISGTTTLVVANAAGSGLGTGNVDIENGGTLQIGAGGPGSIAAAAITDNGALSINVDAADLTFTAVISGTGSVTKANTGLLRLATANSYAGRTTILDGQVRISNATALGTADGLTAVSRPATCRLEIEGGITTAEPLEIASKPPSGGTEYTALLNLSGTNTLTGPISLTSGGNLPSDYVFQSDAGKLVLRGPISTPGGDSRHYWLRGDGDGEIYAGFPSGNNNLVKDGQGTWTLWGTNANTGTNFVNQGAFIVNGRSGGSSVQVYGTLGGTGVITAPVFLNSGTLSPGAEANSLGTLTINSDLTLDGGTMSLFDLSAAGSDRISGLGTLAYDGVLQVTLQGTLAANAVFKLFAATNYTGMFHTFYLPNLPAPLVWDTSFLAVDGTLRITGGPTVTTYGFGGSTTFRLAGTGAVDQPFRVLATTNLNLPLINWTQVGSGTFTGGAFDFTDTQATNYPRRFYQIVSP